MSALLYLFLLSIVAIEHQNVSQSSVCSRSISPYGVCRICSDATVRFASERSAATCSQLRADDEVFVFLCINTKNVCSLDRSQVCFSI